MYFFAVFLMKILTESVPYYADLLTGAAHLNRPSLQGSVFWMAPEVVKQTSYTAKADIWSLGCLIVEMFTGHHPWMELTQMQAIFKVSKQACVDICLYGRILSYSILVS